MSQINSLLVFEVEVEVVPVGALAAAVSILFSRPSAEKRRVQATDRDMSMIDQ
ncbi:hypothetical protein [uncultured Agrobacterium sp.]|uniref:hypothetical protein n=1 Tax=uncultured Agrobacterium sp. TaxID=157277 RepID=UPI0025F460DE|nr:hypothetical protein [uncultured Agrobacterium sp.]